MWCELSGITGCRVLKLDRYISRKIIDILLHSIVLFCKFRRKIYIYMIRKSILCIIEMENNNTKSINIMS